MKNKSLNQSKSQSSISGKQSAARNFVSLLQHNSSKKKRAHNMDMFKSPLMNKLANSSVQLLDLPPDERLAAVTQSRQSSSKVLLLTADSKHRTNKEYRDLSDQQMKDQGYTDDQVSHMQSNMLLFKSIAQVKDRKTYLKAKMTRAQQLSSVKSKVSTHRPSSPKKIGARSSSIKQEIKRPLSPEQKHAINLKLHNDPTSAQRKQKLAKTESELMENFQKQQVYSRQPKHIKNDPIANLRHAQLTAPSKTYNDESFTKVDIIDDDEPVPHHLDFAPAPHFMENSTIASPDKQSPVKMTEKLPTERSPIQFDTSFKSPEITFSPVKDKVKSSQKSKGLTMSELAQSPQKSAKKTKRPSTGKKGVKSKKKEQKTDVQQVQKADDQQVSIKNMKKQKETVSKQVFTTKKKKGQMAGAPSPQKLTYTQKNESQVQQVDLGASAATFAQTSYFGSPEPQRTKLESSMTSNMFKSPDIHTQTKVQEPVTYDSPRGDTSDHPVNHEDSDIEDQKVEFRADKAGNFKKDLAGFIESETMHYKRKEDAEVKALLEEFRNGGSAKKESYPGKYHKFGDSPTRRLIQMKKAAHIHHPSVKQIRSNSVPNNYSIRYVTSPKKSFVVNPKDGEINYDMAYKNFDKFYKKVSNQKINKFSIKEDMTRKNENKKDKWFKTPNAVKVKEQTRPMMRLNKEKVHEMTNFLLGKYK